jgi:hypothetical protein
VLEGVNRLERENLGSTKQEFWMRLNDIKKEGTRIPGALVNLGE